MKNYTITVNGNTYHVSVEEGFTASQPTAPAAPTVSAPAPASVAAPAASAPAQPAAPAAAPTGTAGNIKVSSPMPGKILAVKVSVGQAVKKGDVIFVLEAMKMENEIVSPQEGIIASIDVSAGQTVEAGNLLATLN